MADAEKIRAEFRQKELRIQAVGYLWVLLGLAVGIAAVILELDLIRRAKEITHYDRVQLMRLVDDIVR